LDSRIEENSSDVKLCDRKNFELKTMPDSEQKDSVVLLLTEQLKELRRLTDAKATERTREILSVEQAAEYLGQSVHTLRDWVRLRKIPFSKINGTIKFKKSRLEQWLDQHEIAMME
jgi:excisionase family DNA binding protein